MAMNREERRGMKNKIAPIAKKIVVLEKQIRRNENKEAAEAEIERLVSSLTLMEMMALEDYIASKGLLDIK